MLKLFFLKFFKQGFLFFCISFQSQNTCRACLAARLMASSFALAEAEIVIGQSSANAMTQSRDILFHNYSPFEVLLD